MLLACAERAGVVDQNWDRNAERAGHKGLPEVKGPLDAVAANMTQEGQWCVIKLSGLGVLVLRCARGRRCYAAIFAY